MKLGRLLATTLLLTAAACTDGTQPSGASQILLTDSPFPYGEVARVDVFIEQVDASLSTDTVPGSAWTTIAAPQQSFNLLELQGGSTAVLGTDLPAGEYRAVRMVIDPARSHVRRADGSEVTVHWPQTPTGKIIMHALVEEPLAVATGAKIVIDFDVGRSFLVLESSPIQLVFSPWIRAVNDAATGSIEGQVYWSTDIEGNGGGPLANASVSAYTVQTNGHVGWVAATGRTDAQGNYNITYLREGTYVLAFEGTSPSGLSCTSLSDVPVVRREVTTRNGVAFPGLGCHGDDPFPDSGNTNPDTIPTPGGPVATVRVQAWQTLVPVHVGDSLGVYAELLNAAGEVLSGRSISWNISDTTVVCAQGIFGQTILVRGLKPGPVTVTATSEGKSGSTQVSFVGPGTATCPGSTTGGGVVAYVTLSPPSLNPAVGDSIGAYARIFDAADHELSIAAITVNFSVSDSTVVRIMGSFGQSVVMQAKKVGTATLTATVQGKSVSGTVTVH